MSFNKNLDNGASLVSEKELRTKHLMSELEKNFLKDIQKLKNFKSYIDMDVYIEKEDMHLQHKCVLLCLAPTLYEYLFLKNEICYNILDFPESMPLIEQNSLRNIYKQKGQNDFVSNHEVDITLLCHSPVHSDIAFKVNDEIVNCHKCILSVRCEYFEIMFNGHWLETSQDIIPINGISVLTFRKVIEFLYNPKIQLPEDINLSEVAFVADMFMIGGLKQIVKFHLELEYCHFFHQPCNICVKQIIHAISLSELHGYIDLSVKCFNWLVKHYASVFISREFNNCKQATRELIIEKIKESVSAVNILQHLKFCNKLIKTLPSTNWANKTRDLISGLNSFCLKYVCDNFEKISKQPFFILVCYDKKNLIWMEMAQDFVISSLKTFLSIENCITVHLGIVQINSYLNVLKQTQESEGYELCSSFTSKLNELLKQFAAKNFLGIRRASYWKNLSEETKHMFTQNSGFLVS